MTGSRSTHATLILGSVVVLIGLSGQTTRAQIAIDEALQSLPGEIDSTVVTVPPPSLTDEMDSQAQQMALESVAGKYPLDRFTRNSIVAPFSFKRASIKDASGQRIGHQIDVWFVAYGPLDAISDKNLFRKLVDAGDGNAEGRGDRLDAEALAQRGIKDAGQSETPIAYFQFSIPVLDRILVEGVGRGVSIVTPESHFAAVVLEPRFDGDAEHPNRWKNLKSKTESWFGYRGCGGYAKATRLAGYEDALLIECHAVLHEPKDWFGGANLLGSKLPLAVQNAVRDFRRVLAKQK